MTLPEPQNAGAAFLCRICGDQPWWRIERSDGVVTWACPEDLSTACMDLVRPGLRDSFYVREAEVVVSP